MIKRECVRFSPVELDARTEHLSRRRSARDDDAVPRSRRIVAAPAFIQPMSAHLVDALPEGPEWMYEVKFDGYRALVI